MKRAVITVVGKDSVGIIAKVCTYLAEKSINILDISQTIVGGFFNMMMIVDVSAYDEGYQEMADGLEGLGEDIGCTVKIQREEIFNSMNRI
ncbi:MAG: ACT domain-containing protein [Eubacterium sp.]|nr:ACT domain-containing protein [Eubacterium sp.]